MRRIFGFIVMVAVVTGGQALAQGERGKSANRNDGVRAAPGEARSYGWTTERMRTAKPMPLPVVDPNKPR